MHYPMSRLEQLTAKQLYRGILKRLKTYPSMKRESIIEATKLDVAQWKVITDDEEKGKAMKKMRMFYGHLTMWNEKMTEIRRSD